MAQIKKRAELTLADKLSRLNFDQACKLLGTQGTNERDTMLDEYCYINRWGRTLS